MATKKATKKTAKKTAKKATKKVAKKAVKKATKKVAKKAVVKKTTAKTAPVKKVKKGEEKSFAQFEGTYFYAVGRRKTAVAQVRIYERASETSDHVVNKRPFGEYFPTEHTQSIILSPLEASGMNGKFAVSILVRGGGSTGQADAIKLAIARALTKFDIALRPVLKAQGMMTRDARKVERKKPGLKKARRAPQWAKR